MKASCIISVAVALLAMAAIVYADCPTFSVKGTKYALLNNPQQPGAGDVCPEGKPSTVTFCNSGIVKIVGNFAGAGIGVCNPIDNPYTIPANLNITYEQYCDTVILRIPGFVAAAFRVFQLGYSKKVAVGLSGQLYGVSHFTSACPSQC